MKRIWHYIIILFVFCRIGFLSAGVYAARGENRAYNLPQAVEAADEASPGGQPVSNTAPKSTQEEKGIGPAQPLTIEAPSLPAAKDAKESVQKENLAELRAFVDKSSITIGEKVTYTLEIDADNDLNVEFPSYVSELGGFVVKDFGKDDKRMGRRRSRKTQWYLLDTYTTGSYIIPEQEVKVKLPNGKAHALKSPQIFVEVKSVIDEKKEKAGLRDIKEPLAVKAEAPIILIIAGILIILAGTGIILWKLYRERFAAKKIEPALTPDKKALRELERIENLGLIEEGRIKEYYYRVSLALRTYLENRFSLKAPEQTTEEFLESVACSDKLERRHINILKEYLNHCDLVKYAKFDPGKIQGKRLIGTTRHFIEETAQKREEDKDNIAAEAQS